MTNALSPITHDQQRILTTQQLAEFYGTDTRRISENYNRNKSHYVEGKHFYLLEGSALKAFKREYANCVVAENINKYYLWTERGALLHAKSIGTDRAWEVYEHLVETYFRAREQQPTMIATATVDPKLVNVYLRIANNKNIPVAQKEMLMDITFKQITGQDIPIKNIEKEYVNFNDLAPGLNRIAWMDMDGIRYMNATYDRPKNEPLTVVDFKEGRQRIRETGVRYA